MNPSTYNWTLGFVLFNIGYFYTVMQMFALPDERLDYEG